jgi:hypothetical protein
MLLTKAEELLLLQFHDQGQVDPLDAKPRPPLPTDADRELADDATDEDFDEALLALLARHLLRRDGGRYVLTEQGRQYIYDLEADRPTPES